MNIAKIGHRTALALFVLLLAGPTWFGLFSERIGSRDINEWIHNSCLAQAVLLASCAVYGPGRFVVRMPLVAAWGLAIGCALARLNLISLEGRASIAAGAVLVITGTLAPLIVFGLHRWRTSASLTVGDSRRHVARRGNQLSLQMLMLVTTAFAVAGVVARAALTAPPDPYGREHNILLLHAWLGFFPCLSAAPALIVVFRPSWRIALACFFFVAIALIDPLLWALASPFIFQNAGTVSNAFTWESLQATWIDAMTFNGQTVCATVIYAILARAAGIRMLGPGQSNDRSPKPSAQPATEAGWVQD